MLHKLLITRLKCYGPDDDTIFTTVHTGVFIITRIKEIYLLIVNRLRLPFQICYTEDQLFGEITWLHQTAPAPPCGPKMHFFSKVKVNQCFFVTFNFIIGHICREKPIEIPEVVQKILFCSINYFH